MKIELPPDSFCCPVAILLWVEELQQLLVQVVGHKDMTFPAKQYPMGSICFIGKGTVVCNIAHTAKQTVAPVDLHPTVI